MTRLSGQQTPQKIRSYSVTFSTYQNIGAWMWSLCSAAQHRWLTRTCDWPSLSLFSQKKWGSFWLDNTEHAAWSCGIIWLRAASSGGKCTTRTKLWKNNIKSSAEGAIWTLRDGEREKQQAPLWGLRLIYGGDVVIVWFIMIYNTLSMKAKKACNVMTSLPLKMTRTRK